MPLAILPSGSDRALPAVDDENTTLQSGRGRGDQSPVAELPLAA